MKPFCGLLFFNENVEKIGNEVSIHRSQRFLLASSLRTNAVDGFINSVVLWQNAGWLKQ